MIENNKLNNTKHTAVIPTQVGIWNVESKKPFCPISFCSKMTGPAASNGIFVQPQSCANASIGLSLAALLAGIKPNAMPIPVEQATAPMTDMAEMSIGKSVTK